MGLSWSAVFLASTRCQDNVPPPPSVVVINKADCQMFQIAKVPLAENNCCRGRMSILRLKWMAFIKLKGNAELAHRRLVMKRLSYRNRSFKGTRELGFSNCLHKIILQHCQHFLKKIQCWFLSFLHPDLSCCFLTRSLPIHTDAILCLSPEPGTQSPPHDGIHSGVCAYVPTGLWRTRIQDPPGLYALALLQVGKLLFQLWLCLLSRDSFSAQIYKLEPKDQKACPSVWATRSTVLVLVSLGQFHLVDSNQ